VRQGRSRQLHADPGELLLLPVERQAVDILADRKQIGAARSALAVVLVDLVDNLNARKRLRQGPTAALGAAMRRYSHGADGIGQFSIGSVTQFHGRLGLVEGQCHLVHREALAPCTQVLVAGKANLLQQLVDEQRLLLKLPLLLEDRPAELAGRSAVPSFVSLSLCCWSIHSTRLCGRDPLAWVTVSG